jgi:methyl-accepting chemotaxis protein
VVSRIASGDLSQTVSKKAGDNESLVHEMGVMREQLTSVIAEIRGVAEVINTSTHDIVAGNQEIAEHSEQQAVSLEKTSSSMEEITAAVKQNAENAGQARELARGAVDIASRSGMVMQNVNGTMGDISESAGKIANIIEVVNSIAFQTNILALNAAVEAARAGEQGKGLPWWPAKSEICHCAASGCTGDKSPGRRVGRASQQRFFADQNRRKPHRRDD